MARFTNSAVTIAASLALFGCAAPQPSPDAEPRPAAQPPATISPEPAPPPAPTPPASAPVTVPAPVPPAAAAPPVAPAASNASSSASPGTPSSRPLPKADAASSATQPRPAAPSPAPAAKPAAAESPKAAPTLDLDSLEQRLKDTKAIGIFTKLSLKNQVDDLLGQLRAFHKGAAKTPPAALRQKYDTLIIKVLTLLQDGDPQLASAIASSREALWGILMDPQKFSQI
jgi:hypothetical protein